MINIYARPSFIGNRFHRWSDKLQTLRVSSRVRGEEMAAFLGEKARLNPPNSEVSESDVNIHVKPETLKHVGKGDWLDFLDGGHFNEELRHRPDIKIIACSEHARDTLIARYPNKVVLIPHHHINFERKQKRTWGGVKTVGYLGSYSPKAERHYKWLQDRFDERGLKVNIVANFEYKKREDAIELYRNIDLLIVVNWWIEDWTPYKVPTKIINAASFGVPAIAFPRDGYKEIEGFYVRARGVEELVDGIEDFQEEPEYYKEFSEKVLKMAEKYHIEHSAKLYSKLEK